MATAPMKSKPLHNFSLPYLKWSHKKQVFNNSDNLLRKSALSSCSTQKQDDVFEEDVHQVDESLKRKWNFRSMNVVSKETVEIGIVSKKRLVVVDDDDNHDDYHMGNAILPQKTENQPKSMRLRGLTADGYGMDRRKEKRKFWIALSREEIEEDIYAMTGLKPSRKPKKRLKNVQKQLDNVFPGLNFVGLSSDAYRLNQSLR
ncbi:uncharacterized protein LOC124942939 [Impatiens glandulifera]|uniref:uncharacterized protein LOC124942939 n=1 Tax=Impatiens glandulifera TaxID=253017 RepID=UPI001FB06EB0|nr:uncharacterized protein LOC124942939 [Impatiens glandulifera]